MQITLPQAERTGRTPIKRSALFTPSAQGQGLLAIAVGPETNVYDVSEIGSEIGGRGFRLAKLDAEGEVYHVLIADEVSTLCDCIGFEHTGHCKHVDALRAVIDAGELPPQDPEPEPPAAMLELPPRRLPLDREVIPIDLSHPCQACGVREADERGYPCDGCKREIESDIAMLSHNGRYMRSHQPDEQQHAA
jgi:hypothetical protein